MTRRSSDFVEVQLSAAGLEFAGGCDLRIATLHMHYTFQPGIPVRVLTSEWSRVLERESWKGQALFELAAEAAEEEMETPQADEAGAQEEK